MHKQYQSKSTNSISLKKYLVTRKGKELILLPMVNNKRHKI